MKDMKGGTMKKFVVFSLAISLFLFFLLISFKFFAFSEPAPKDKKEKPQTSPRSKIKPEIKKLVDKITKVPPELFVYQSDMIPSEQKDMKKIYDAFVPNDKGCELIKLYPSLLFYRLIRYATWYESPIYKQTDYKKLASIISKQLAIFLINNDECNNSIKPKYFERVDTLMLVAARYKEVFKALDKKTKTDLIEVSFWMGIHRDLRFHFNAALHNNYAEELIPIMFEIIEKYKKAPKEEITGGFIYFNMTFFPALFYYYNSKYKKKYFELFYSVKGKKDLFSSMIYDAFIELSDEMDNNDDFFEEFFLVSPPLKFLSFEAFPFSSRRHYFLTRRKLRYLKKLWDSVKKKKPDLKLWKRIALFTDNDKKVFYKRFQGGEFYRFMPSEETYERLVKCKDAKEIFEEIEWNFKYFAAECFIEPNTKYILTSLKSPVNSSFNALSRWYRWLPGSPAYGSPNFTTDTFINWEKHKYKYPNYKYMSSIFD